MKKKILYLTQMYPYPTNGGGKIKTLNTLITLASEFQIYAIFINDEIVSQSDIKYLTNFGITVKIFYSHQILTSVKDDLFGLFWHFLHGTPHYVFQYTYLPAFPYIQGIITAFQPDVIHIDHINMAQYLPKKKHQIWILEQHNVEYYLYWTRFLHSGKLTRKAYLLIEMVLTYLFEKKTIFKFDHVFAISKIEEQRMKRVFGIKNVTTQTLVYKTKHIKHTDTNNPYILFIGNVTWPPNEDAIYWFIKKIFPQIQKSLPNTRFHLIGKRYRILEKQLPKNKNIFFHGLKKSLTLYLKKADVFVLPFRMGGGMRIKALTALAAGVPVVSTGLGIEGLNVVNKKDFILAQTPESFAQAVIRVFKNKKLQKDLSKNAIAYMKKNHCQSLNKEFLKKYQQVIRKSS